MEDGVVTFKRVKKKEEKAKKVKKTTK